MSKSILIVGVGGQGTLLASKVLGKALLASGRDVKVSEVHGMSQRGGSVITYVRYGDRGEKVLSPILSEGESDIILSFELLEAARYLPYLKKGGLIVTNSQRIDPMPVITGAAKYPEQLDEKIKSKGAGLISLDALALANRAGSPKAVNLVLLGVLSTRMDIPKELWRDAVKISAPQQFLQINLAAFEKGESCVS